MSKFKLILTISFLVLLISGCSTNYPFAGTFNEADSLIIIDEEHNRNHLGQYHTVSQNFNLNAGQAAGFIGCTDNQTEVHFINFDVIVDSAPVNVEFYEAPTITANGTLTNTITLNRAIMSNSTLTVYSNPTITNDGTLMFYNGILGAKNQAQSNFGITGEWVLNSNECYYFKIINNDGNDNEIIANLIFYEH